MLIFFQKDDLNQKARAALKGHNGYYYNEDKIAVIDDVLIIAEMNADAAFPACYSSEHFAKALVDMGVSSNLKKIFFLTPNVIDKFKKDANILVFAQSVVNNLCENFQVTDIKAHVVFDIRYTATYILPPSETEAVWKIYGRNNKTYSQKQPKDIPIWEGDNILEWIENKPQNRVDYQDFAQQHYRFKL